MASNLSSAKAVNNNAAAVFRQCIVILTTFLLTFESNYYNGLSWYAFTVSFIEENPSLWTITLGMLVSSAAPALSLYSILGNILAVGFIATRQHSDELSPPQLVITLHG